MCVHIHITYNKLIGKEWFLITGLIHVLNIPNVLNLNSDTSQFQSISWKGMLCIPKFFVCFKTDLYLQCRKVMFHTSNNYKPDPSGIISYVLIDRASHT
jgi:hypothetical protein